MITETLTTLVLIVIALIFMNNDVCAKMPSQTHSLLLFIFVAAFLIFAGFILKDRPRDEREALITLKAGRVAYLVGTAVLIGGIAVQASQHAVDPWLVGGAVVMVVVKLITNIYSSRM